MFSKRCIASRQVGLVVGHSEVAVFLDGVYMTSFEGHIICKASAGVLLVNDEGSEARVKDFIVTKKPSMCFYTTSCPSLQSVSDGILFSAKMMVGLSKISLATSFRWT